MKKYAYFILLLFLSLPSCNFEDDSILQEEIKNVTAQELLPSAIQQVAYNHSSIGGRTCAGIMQYLKGLDAKNLNLDQYRLESDYFNSLWNLGYYTGSLISTHDIQTLAAEEGADDLIAIANILQAYEFTMLSSFFGDIPFTEALEGEAFITPKYDTQENVIKGIQELLDDAISLIGTKTSNADIASDDLLYHGDLQLWKKLAIGLKAKYHLNARNRNENLNDEILELINNSFSSSSEQADFVFNNGVPNPQYTFEVTRPSTINISDFFIEQLSSTDDPRFSKFAIEGQFSDWDYFDPENFTPIWFEEMAAIPILSYTELLFIRAEILVHNGSFNSEIAAALEIAIRSSLSENNVLMDATTELFITNMTDFTGLDQEQILERVLEQAYVAYYGFNHQQAWNNFRRTGYPSISSTANPNFPNDNNPSSSIPKRFMYPLSEEVHNEENLEAAINNQEGALLDDALWIFQ